MNKNYENMGKKYDKLQSASHGILERFIEAGTEGDFKTRERKAWTQNIIISKMKARILDDMISKAKKIIKTIDEIRVMRNDPYYEQDDYIFMQSCLMECEDHARHNAKYVLEYAMYVDETSGYYSEAEIRSMLSIGYEDWKRWVDRNKPLMSMLVTKVGNEPLTHHCMDYMMDELTKNPQTREMMRRKTEELFGPFMDFEGGDL
ncbi:hypothetical protein [Paenibacillus ottowii]|uniref:Uncharacterized protein n=1 Tax=Paenibacillus ottowii TaxID=2315729 RepID=A0ABY3BAR6_9BACL|nr:hypothetical protein [Paenibacillus ottowii]TQS01400.1 hypothetical protein FKV70_03445 [Paenibacillus ottowii]TQS01455.1 hypothetical protein FKV70_03735 [Paenibacillus ottowii]